MGLSDASPTDAVSIAGYVFLVISAVPLPYHLYKIWEFYQNLKSVALLRRYPYLALAVSIFFILFAYVYAPYHVLVVAADVITAPSWTSWLLYSLLCHGSSWAYLLRSYLLYFDFQYHQAMSNTAWVTALDADHVEDNWFLQNHRTFGDLTWVGGWIIAPLYSVSVLVGTLSAWQLIQKDNRNSDITLFHPINIGLSLIPWCGVIYVWYEMRFHDVHDFFKIREEMVEGAVVTLVTAVLYVTEYLFFVLIAKYTANIGRGLDVRIDALLFFILCSLWAQAMVTVTTTRVLKKNERYLQLTLDESQLPARRTDGVTHEQALKQIKTHHSGIKIKGTAAFNKEQAKVIQKSSMPMYLGHTRGFQLFMQHLVREFCTENLLFLVQLHQWKDLLRRKHIPKKQFKKRELDYPWKWPASVPKAAFLKGKDDPYVQALSLFEKYVSEEDAEHWVNLRGTTYGQLEKFFTRVKSGDLNKQTAFLDDSGVRLNKQQRLEIWCDLYQLFDQAEQEVLTLLESSWDRFQTSAEYRADKENSELTVSDQSGVNHSVVSRTYANVIRRPPAQSVASVAGNEIHPGQITDYLASDAEIRDVSATPGNLNSIPPITPKHKLTQPMIDPSPASLDTTDDDDDGGGGRSGGKSKKKRRKGMKKNKKKNERRGKHHDSDDDDDDDDDESTIDGAKGAVELTFKAKKTNSILLASGVSELILTPSGDHVSTDSEDTSTMRRDTDRALGRRMDTDFLRPGTVPSMVLASLADNDASEFSLLSGTVDDESVLVKEKQADMIFMTGVGGPGDVTLDVDVEDDSVEKAVKFADVVGLDDKNELREESRQDLAEHQKLKNEEIEDYSDEDVADHARHALAKMGSSKSPNFHSHARIDVTGLEMEPDIIAPVMSIEPESVTRTSLLMQPKINNRQSSTSDLPAMSLTSLMHRSSIAGVDESKRDDVSLSRRDSYTADGESEREPTAPTVTRMDPAPPELPPVESTLASSSLLARHSDLAITPLPDRPIIHGPVRSDRDMSEMSSRKRDHTVSAAVSSFDSDSEVNVIPEVSTISNHNL